MSFIVTDYRRFRTLREDGLYRHTHEAFYSDVLINAALQLSRDSEFHPDLKQLLGEFSDVVAAKRRPIDTNIRNFLLYTNPELVEQALSRGNHNIRNRISVAARFTSRGNFSVTISPDRLNCEGRFERAPEWINDPFPAYAEVTQRPYNEVLFLRNVERWFNPYLHKDPSQAAIRSSACEAINIAFWLTLRRLSETFQISYKSYLAGVSNADQELVYQEGNLIGLEIVDAVEDMKQTLQESVRDFEPASGFSPEAFYAGCMRENDDWRRFENASRKLRQAPGANRLTPKTVEQYFDLLDAAKHFGIWNPTYGG